MAKWMSKMAREVAERVGREAEFVGLVDEREDLSVLVSVQNAILEGIERSYQQGIRDAEEAHHLGVDPRRLAKWKQMAGTEPPRNQEDDDGSA